MHPLRSIALVVIACSPFIFGPLRQQSMGFRLVIALFVGLAFFYLQDFLGYASLVLCTIACLVRIYSYYSDVCHRRLLTASCALSAADAAAFPYDWVNLSESVAETIFGT